MTLGRGLRLPGGGDVREAYYRSRKKESILSKTYTLMPVIPLPTPFPFPFPSPSPPLSPPSPPSSGGTPHPKPTPPPYPNPLPKTQPYPSSLPNSPSILVSTTSPHPPHRGISNSRPQSNPIQLLVPRPHGYRERGGNGWVVIVSRARF